MRIQRPSSACFKTDFVLDMWCTLMMNTLIWLFALYWFFIWVAVIGVVYLWVEVMTQLITFESIQFLFYVCITIHVICVPNWAWMAPGTLLGPSLTAADKQSITLTWFFIMDTIYSYIHKRAVLHFSCAFGICITSCFNQVKMYSNIKTLNKCWGWFLFYLQYAIIYWCLCQ